LEGWEVVSRDNWWVKPLLSDLRRWFIWTGILRLVMEVLLCDEGTQRALCESKEIPRSHGLTGILPLRWHATRGSLRISACLCAYRWIRVDERCIWVLCRYTAESCHWDMALYGLGEVTHTIPPNAGSTVTDTLSATLDNTIPQYITIT
jgi:membrane-associated PAP2 superfamily phosphatase